MNTVLVCDDQPALRELIRAALAEGAYEVVEAPDGAEALRAARERGPDVIILDMVLPDQSGLDVLARLRTEPALATTPVILCTAHPISLGGDNGNGLGADRYLQKPFSPRDLLAIVDELAGTAS